MPGAQTLKRCRGTSEIREIRNVSWNNWDCCMPHASRMTCVRKIQADRALRKMRPLGAKWRKELLHWKGLTSQLRFLCQACSCLWAEPSQGCSRRSGGIAFYICSTLYCDFGSAMRIALSPSKLVPVWHILLAWHQEKHFLSSLPVASHGRKLIFYTLTILRVLLPYLFFGNTIPYFAKVWRQFSSAGCRKYIVAPSVGCQTAMEDFHSYSYTYTTCLRQSLNEDAQRGPDFAF